MKHPRDNQQQEQEVVSLALSLSTTTADSSATTTTTSDSATATAGYSPAATTSNKRARRRGPVVATSGEGEFVCKTCGRAFTSFQALGGHRTSHLRGRRHGLELGVGAKAFKQHKAAAAGAGDGNSKGAGAAGGGGDSKPQHECHICGQGFEMGQALGGHMRRHREEMGAAEAADAWVWLSVARIPAEELEVPRAASAAEPPVLLELFA